VCALQISIEDYQLYLFDFDGLLVDTEKIHWEAYRKMCANRGLELDWSFPKYCQAAHYGSEALKRNLYAHIPQLLKQEADWRVLYREKKEILLHLLREGSVSMMPGAAELLKTLEIEGVTRCVVTHSPEEQIQAIRDKHPILNTISVWLTREAYTHPKPHPECYLKAIDMLWKPGENVIGFEDTPRGLQALLHTSATPVLVTQVAYREIPQFIEKGVVHLSSLTAVSV